MGNWINEHLPVAIVGSTPHSDDRMVEHQFVALHCELMCSSNEVNGIVMRERFGDVRPEKKARSTGRKPPTSYIYVRVSEVAVAVAAHFLFTNVRITRIARNRRKEKKKRVCEKLTIWVRPQKVTHCAVVGDLLLSINSANLVIWASARRQSIKGVLDLVDGLQGRTQATVDAKDATIYDSTQGEIVEDFAAPAPYVTASVLALTLVVKAIYLCDLP